MQALADALANVQDAWSSLTGESSDSSAASSSGTGSGLGVHVGESRLAIGPNGETFREFRVDCTLGNDQWHVWRRYSQFVALRAALRQKGGCVAHEVAVNESLPAKGSLLGVFTWHDVSQESAELRVAGLCRWVQGVVAIQAASGSPSLLAFLGVASVETRERAPIHVRAICSAGMADASLRRDSAGIGVAPETGDVFLFRTRGRTMPALQRAVTGSSWDHVGLLVFRDGQGRVCRSADCKAPGGCAGVLECDSNGTKWYPLRAYELEWHEFFDEIALRPLLWPGRGSAETVAILQARSPVVSVISHDLRDLT